MNIFDADLDFKGRDVYVIGSGPNAAPYMLIPESAGAPVEIPLHAKVIACNKGISCRAAVTVWLCATPALAREPWFPKKMRTYGAMTPALANVCKPLIVGRRGDWLRDYAAFTHYFYDGPSLWSDAKRDGKTDKLIKAYKGFGCTNGYLRGGASAVARGVQLAWFKEAARCILIGADMYGTKYYDGTANKSKPSTLDKDGNWLELTYFNELIKWVQTRDMDVVSLTETALNIEVI